MLTKQMKRGKHVGFSLDFISMIAQIRHAVNLSPAGIKKDRKYSSCLSLCEQYLYFV